MAYNLKPKMDDGRRRGRSLDYILSTMDAEKPPEANPENCWEHHHAIARLVVAGCKNTEIARHIGVDKQTVSNVRNSPVVKAQIARLRGEAENEIINAHRIIREAAEDAARVMVDCIQNPNAEEALRVRTAKDVLGLAGIVTPKNVNVQHAGEVTHLTAQQIERLRDQGQRVINHDDPTVDADYEEIED